MLNEKILCAGFGGQGVMSLGKLIAYGAMLDGREVTWMPSYGPEMRGGTAYCSVVVSDKPIGSPIVTSGATSLIVMNLPSLDRFEQSVIPGGLIVMNSSMIEREVVRTDLEIHALEACSLAETCADQTLSNVVMLGAYTALRGIPRMNHTIRSLKDTFGLESSARMDVYLKALQCGIDAVTMPTQPRKAA